MSIALPLAIGALFASSIYMILGRDLIRIAVGILLLGVAANLLILVAGRIGTGVPPLVAEGAIAASALSANPLPQALILTAIVISFGLSAFAIVLFWVTQKVFRHLDTERHRLAEPAGSLDPQDVAETPAARPERVGEPA